MKLSSQSESQSRVDLGDAASKAARKYDDKHQTMEQTQTIKLEGLFITSTYLPTILEQVAVVHAVKDAMQRPPVLVVGDPSTVVALPSSVVQGLERDSDLGGRQVDQGDGLAKSLAENSSEFEPYPLPTYVDFASVSSFLLCVFCLI